MYIRQSTRPISVIDLFDCPKALRALRRGDPRFRGAFLMHVADHNNYISVWVRAVCRDGTEALGLLSRELAQEISRALGSRARWLTKAVPLHQAAFRAREDPGWEREIH